MDLSDKILKYVASHKAVTTKDVAEAVGVSKDRAARALKKLAENGKVLTDVIKNGAIKVFLWKAVTGKDAKMVISIDDISDKQLSKALEVVNVEALAKVTTAPKGIRKRGAMIHDRATKLGLKRGGKRMLRRDMLSFIRTHKKAGSVLDWAKALA